MMDFSIISLFSALRNSATGETERDLSCLLQSMITLYLRARTFKFVSIKKEAFKLESSEKKMKSLRHP